MSRKKTAATSAHSATRAEASPKRDAKRATPAWKLEDAKARFSEVVRRARTSGPQRVTCRGEDAVVVVSAGEFERLAGQGRPRQSLVEFLRGTALGELDMRRPVDRGRNVRL